MKQIARIFNKILILILTISFFGCNEDNDTKYPETLAGYTYTINPETGTVSFINISEGASEYFWDFGDKQTSTEINPIKTFSPGTYTVVLTSKNLAGDSDIFTSTITIAKATINCTSETVETLAATGLNMTFKSEPVASTIFSDGVTFTWASNPSYDNVLNSSCKVAQITKLGNNPWDNFQINLNSKLDFNANGGLKLKVFSVKAGFKVRIKLEEIGNAGNNTELEVASTKTSEWEELTFPFATTANNKFNKIVIFFDLDAKNKDTYYFDDLKVYERVGGVPTAACTAETLETLTATGLNMTFKSAPVASTIVSDGVTFNWASNPSYDNALNSSCKVAQIIKLGSNAWDNFQINLNAKLDFTANAGLKIKVYSAKAGFKVRVKLEEIGNPGNNKELEVVSTKTNEWEELTFPFDATNTNKFNKVVLFFDLNANNKDTYYFDDLKVYDRVATGGGGGSGTCPAPPAGDLIPNGNFEAGNGCWELINNGGTVTISSTESSGSGSKSGQIKTAPSKNPAVKQTRFAVGTVLPNRSYRVTFDIKASASKPLVDGAVFQAFIFSEGVDGGSTGAIQHVLVQGLGSVSTSWESKSYTFTSGAAAANVAGGFSFLAELVCGGAATCDGTINIDNVSIKLIP